MIELATGEITTEQSTLDFDLRPYEGMYKSFRLEFPRLETSKGIPRLRVSSDGGASWIEEEEYVSMIFGARSKSLDESDKTKVYTDTAWLFVKSGWGGLGDWPQDVLDLTITIPEILLPDKNTRLHAELHLSDEGGKSIVRSNVDLFWPEPAAHNALRLFQYGQLPGAYVGGHWRLYGT